MSAMNAAPRKPNNLKTALILGGVALFFFVSVFVKFTWLS
ncbi:cytochrome oxidase small assembly protein [Massilia niastensis]|nr:cytochrome oxidase small assembly protein [Massilia niastensis]